MFFVDGEVAVTTWTRMSWISFENVEKQWLEEGFIEVARSMNVAESDQ